MKQKTESGKEEFLDQATTVAKELHEFWVSSFVYMSLIPLILLI